MNNQNINKIINEIFDIEQEEAYQAGAIKYMARSLIQATMPHSKINSHEFKRSNGIFQLTMLANSEIGLPYGSIPRLLMTWITTEAVRTRQRELILGRTLSEFMAELDMIPSGGRWGSITRLKDQMKRLFSASISCTYKNKESWGIHNIVPIEKANLWWNSNPYQVTMWESSLLLGESFFQEIIENPVPIDIRALKALKQSPMAIDIYCWLTYRMSYLKKITCIPWEVLQIQFGSNYKDKRQFKRRFLEQLKKVLFVYSNAKVKEEVGKLILFPSKPHIQRQVKPIMLNEADIKKIKEEHNYKESIKTDLKKKYLQYQLDEVVEIVENLSDEKERNTLLKAFEEYLTRKGLNEILAKIKKGKHTNDVKEELYNFVNSNWHDILTSIKSYKEFYKSISN